MTNIFTTAFQKVRLNPDVINQDVEMVWNELEVNAKRVLIGNIYISPNKILSKYVYLTDFWKTRDIKQL